MHCICTAIPSTSLFTHKFLAHGWLSMLYIIDRLRKEERCEDRDVAIHLIKSQTFYPASCVTKIIQPVWTLHDCRDSAEPLGFYMILPLWQPSSKATLIASWNKAEDIWLCSALWTVKWNLCHDGAMARLTHSCWAVTQLRTDCEHFSVDKISFKSLI